MAKIYYSVNKHATLDADGAAYFDGTKEVNVYRVRNNELELLTVLELDNYDNSEKEIKVFLDDEGFEDCELVLL